MAENALFKYCTDRFGIKTMLLILLGFSIFIGFMTATAGIVMMPRITSIAAPLLCQEDHLDIKITPYSVPPATQGYTVEFFCPGKLEQVSDLHLMRITFLIATIAALILLIVLLGLFFMIGPPLARLWERFRPRSSTTSTHLGVRFALLVVIGTALFIACTVTISMKYQRVVRLHVAIEQAEQAGRKDETAIAIQRYNDYTSHVLNGFIAHMLGYEKHVSR